MGKSIKFFAIWLIIVVLLFHSVNVIAFPGNDYKASSLENLEFRQEILIPIDTSLDEAKFQPVDMNIDFENSCWAIDEKTHSIRIAYECGSELIELDSQVYDLEYVDDSHVKSCNFVFLIPEEANGNEKYYVLYDSCETESVEYDDHLNLEDTHYFFEPISGQKIDFDYYKITEDGYVIYGIVQKGEILGNPVAQYVVESKPKSKEIDTTAIDQLGAFDMRYGIKGEPDYTGTTDAIKVVKNIVVDGNLMVRVRVETISPNNEIKTDNIYTYYYCPSEIKRIRVNCHHEVLKNINIEDPDVYDGTYAGIVSIKSRSATIEKMNVGDILPSMSLYSEDNKIESYSIPQNPDSIEKESVLSTNADSDLGIKAWVCLNDPSTGKTHGLIMDSNTGITKSDRDGIQIKAFVKQNVKLPGLEADTGSLFMLRNSYEKNNEHNTILSKGFTAGYNVEFIKILSEGVERVDIESEIFQSLIKKAPYFRGNETFDETEEEKFTVSTYVHFARSFPLGSLLSAATGLRFPYIYAELYEDNSYLSAGSVGRIGLSSIDLDFEGNIFQKLRKAIGMFDWRNISFFKKIVFPDVTAGRYVVKIYRENPALSKQRQYIGYASFEVEQDTRIDINCRTEGKIKLSAKNQNNEGVKNIKFLLVKDDGVAADSISDENGSAVLKAPIYPTKPYTLKVFYQGFLVEEKKIKVGLLNRIIAKSETFKVPFFKLSLSVKDLWGFSPEIDVNPTITSPDMFEKNVISPQKIGDGEYIFTNLYPADYVLSMNYKSFEMVENVKLDNDGSLSLDFPAEYALDFDLMNSYGYQLDGGYITVLRNGREIKKSINENGRATMVVPPGKYKLMVYSDDDLVASQIVDVRSDKELDVITSVDSLIHSVVLFLGIILGVCSIFYLFWKKRIYASVKLIVIGILLIAIISPWWVLSGDDGVTKTNTKTLLVPSNIVTFTSSNDMSGGEISLVPEEVTMALSLFSILIVVSILFIISSIFMKNRFRRITIFISTLSVILLIATIGIFYYTMMQLTDVGVGGFMGSGDLDITLPGVADNQILNCSWGPGIGFYLGIIAIICLIVLSLFKKSRFFSNKMMD